MNNKVMEHFKDFVSYLWEFQSPEILKQETKLKIMHAVIWACIEDTNKNDQKINKSIVELVSNFDKYYKKVLDDYNHQIDLILSWKWDKKYNSKQKKTDMYVIEWFALEWKKKMKEILENTSKKAV